MSEINPNAISNFKVFVGEPIADCPYCGLRPREIGEGYTCCGVSCVTADKWNLYAYSMQLRKAVPWATEVSDLYNTWIFCVNYDADRELTATCQEAVYEVTRLLEVLE